MAPAVEHREVGHLIRVYCKMPNAPDWFVFGKDAFGAVRYGDRQRAMSLIIGMDRRNLGSELPMEREVSGRLGEENQ